MTTKTPSNKPFHLVERKSGPKNSVSETDICQFIQILTTNIRLNDKWSPYTQHDAAWKPRKSPNRGFVGAEAADKSSNVDAMLSYVASYCPKHLLREITERSTSLKAVWSLLRKWAGIQPTGLKLLEYTRMQNMWDPSGDMNPAEYFYALLDTMQDVLLVRQGKVQFNDEPVTEDEEMTPTLQSTVVKDWLVAMGGAQLFEHVCRVYSKDLETNTLADIQHRICQNLDSLQADLEVTAGAVSAMKVFTSNRGRGKSRSARFQPTPATAPKRESRDQKQKNRHCILCEAMGRKEAMNSHTLASCYLVDRDDRVEMARIQCTLSKDQESDTESSLEDSSQSED